MELAGSAGFEPATRLATHTRLPSGRIRPLSQLPKSYAVMADDDIGARAFYCLCRKSDMHTQRSRHADSMRCRTDISDSWCLSIMLSWRGQAESNRPVRFCRPLPKPLGHVLVWWARQVSNLRPCPCRGPALPAELRAQSKSLMLPLSASL